MRKTETTTTTERTRPAQARPASRPAQRRFQIHVTDKDIARAQRNNSYHCVVTQAIARIIPDAARIEVDTQSIRFTRAQSGERYVYLTPYAAQGYVIAFDAGEPIEPFSFRLNEQRMLHVRRQLSTPAGKAARKAAQRVRDAARRLPPGKPAGKTGTAPHLPGGKTGGKTGGQTVVPAGRPRGNATIAADARVAYAQARAAHPGPIQTTSEGERRSPRRVFKTGIRTYGERMLRVNRAKPVDMPPPSVAAE